jgi:2-keto-4-pentenoate hydratase/2-oxohepta-3-ene-1,7-dioic acid hydratase in catechol pathway
VSPSGQDEVSKPADPGVRSSFHGVPIQQTRSSQLILSVARLFVELSAITTFMSGDIVVTGTPSGVGFVRQPSPYLQLGHTLESWTEGIGTLRNRRRWGPSKETKCHAY